MTSIKKINVKNGWYYVSYDECPKNLKNMNKNYGVTHVYMKACEFSKN